jgi:hypothetical protein
MTFRDENSNVVFNPNHKEGYNRGPTARSIRHSQAVRSLLKTKNKFDKILNFLLLIFLIKVKIPICKNNHVTLKTKFLDKRRNRRKKIRVNRN